MDHRCGPVAGDSRVRAHRVSPAVGSKGVLGDDRHDQHRKKRPARRTSCRLAAGGDHSRFAHLAAMVRGTRVPAAVSAHRLRDRASVPDATTWNLRCAQAGRWRRQAVLPVSRAEGHDRWRARLLTPVDVRDRVSRSARSDRRSIGRRVRPSPRVVLPQSLPAAEVLPWSSRAAGDDGHSGAGGGPVVAAAISRSTSRPAMSSASSAPTAAARPPPSACCAAC